MGNSPKYLSSEIRPNSPVNCVIFTRLREGRHPEDNGPSDQCLGRTLNSEVQNGTVQGMYSLQGIYSLQGMFGVKSIVARTPLV